MNDHKAVVHSRAIGKRAELARQRRMLAAALIIERKHTAALGIFSLCNVYALRVVFGVRFIPKYNKPAVTVKLQI